MTGDGWPDLAIGAPQADPGGRANAGSVWIISGHLPPIDAGCSGMLVDASCPWIKLNGPITGYRIDGAVAGQGLGSALAGVGDQNGDGLPDIAIGASAASPAGREGAGEIVVMAGQSGSATRDTSAALQRIEGPAAGAGLGASLASAGDVDGDGRADLLAGAPGESARAERRTSCAEPPASATSQRVRSCRGSRRRGAALRPAAPSPPGRATRSSLPPAQAVTAPSSASRGAAGRRWRPRPPRLRSRPPHPFPQPSPGRR